MITYVAINLTNKKFQVGSTTDFKRRCREHHNRKGDLEFQRSLCKNPENFYWIVSEDDGLETRDEEQYYLNFYHGTMWCYNHNPSASVPPSGLGTGGPTHPLYGTTWSEERRQKHSLLMSGENNPYHGYKHSEEQKQKQRERQTGKKFGPRSKETCKKISEALRGNPGMGHRRKKCEIIFPDGVKKVYSSVTEASEDTNIPKATLTRWARSMLSKKGYLIRYLEG